MNEVPNRQKGKIMERNYEEIFQKVLDYEQALHEKNRKRIKIGLKCIWIVPLFFLALLFLTGSNKVIFLILWIVSLFALSIYLIVGNIWIIICRRRSWSSKEKKAISKR